MAEKIKGTGERGRCGVGRSCDESSVNWFLELLGTRKVLSVYIRHLRKNLFFRQLVLIRSFHVCFDCNDLLVTG